MSGFIINEESCRYGGLSELRLVSVNDVLAAKFDKASGCFTEIVLSAGVAAACYEFEEDTAFYRQTLAGDYPYEKVIHEISFALPYFDSSSVNALSALLEAAPGGLVALATTAAGETFLVGWSVGCEEESPLRLVSVKTDTRADYAEDSYCTVELRSEDLAFARLFIGSL